MLPSEFNYVTTQISFNKITKYKTACEFRSIFEDKRNLFTCFYQMAEEFESLKKRLTFSFGEVYQAVRLAGFRQ
jgi:hypothetical protein